MESTRIKLDEHDFKTLVSGGVVSKTGARPFSRMNREPVEVEIALDDIGYMTMINILSALFQSDHNSPGE